MNTTPTTTNQATYTLATTLTPWEATAFKVARARLRYAVSAGVTESRALHSAKALLSKLGLPVPRTSKQVLAIMASIEVVER